MSLFFDDLLDAYPASSRDYAATWVREFNPRYAEAEGVPRSREQFPPSLESFGVTDRHHQTDIYGDPPSPEGYGGTGREFVKHLRNRGKFFDHEEKRERDLILS